MKEPPSIGRRQRAVVSLEKTLLLHLTLLAAAAAAFAVVGVLAIQRIAVGPLGALLALSWVAGVIALFALFCARTVRAGVVRPLEVIAAAANVIAGGSLTRRVSAASTAEHDRLVESVNFLAERLLEGQSRLAHLEKMASLGQLAAGVAQEIAAPLAAIHGHVQRLRNDVQRSSPSSSALDQIGRETDRIGRIVRGMLDYARPTPRTAARVDLNEAIRRAVDSLEHEGALAAVQLEIALAPQLDLVRGDSAEITLVISNLLMNAMQAMGGVGRATIVTQQTSYAALMREGERRSEDRNDFTYAREPSTRLRAWLARAGQPERVVKVIVADSGPGVVWSEMEKIFDPFYTTQTASGGAGLGLAVVARIVESMAGAVWVRPSREGGAAFVMFFPVARDEDEKAR
ncbi:MAG: ATP-binding protein [Gemmatimonadota bacterium]|nr:ATP-binding protein [Gemmatimonadota bacterium]